MERSPFVQVAVIGHKRCLNLHALYMTIQDITCSQCHAKDLGGKRHGDCSKKDAREDAEAGLGLDLKDIALQSFPRQTCQNRPA